MSTARTIPVWAPVGDAVAGWFDPQPRDRQHDVVVVGAGIAGLTTAACLLREGRRVLVIDRQGVGAGETLRTTAHLASALDDRYHLLQRHHGAEGARLAAASHAAAIDWIEALASGASDCGFRRVPGYLFSHTGEEGGLRKELEAAREAGLEVDWCEPGTVPGIPGPALRFGNQARVDAGGYLLALAREVRHAGGRFLRAHVQDISGGAEPELHLDDGSVLRARAVVAAGNVPFHGTTATFPKQAPYRTYVVAGRVPAGAVPDALVWDDADPYHYVRLREGDDPAWMEILVGGEDHKTGQDDDPEAYVRLQAWTREHFPQVQGFHAAWSGQVLEPADGLGLIGAAFALFRTERTGTGKGWRWRRKPAAAPVPASLAVAARTLEVPTHAPSRGPLATARQFLSMLLFDAGSVFRSIPLIVMLLFGLANFVPSLLTMDFMYGTATHPVTSRVADVLQASYSWLLVIVVLFYAGELAARPRAARVNEVVDAMPTPDWMPVLAKLGALFLVVVVFQALGALVGIVYQVSQGMPVEPLTWIKILANGSIFFGLMAMLALALQGITHNKFAGYALLIAVLLGQGVLAAMDLDHNLYNIASAPNAPWSDMNGYGHFLATQWGFQGYWALFMVALLAVASALWVRGTETTWGRRLAAMRGRLRGPTGVVLAVSLAGFVAMGGWLFWNTNIRNDYRNPDDQRDLMARYEREYKQYQDLPQPKIEAVHIDVDLRPQQQSMRATGRYRLVNPHATPISDVHVHLADDKALAAIDFGGQQLVTYDEPIGYRIYRLDRPLQPGERREMTFSVDYHPTGIRNGGAQSDLVANGTFFNTSYFPGFGYEAGAELTDRNERRERGMGEPTRMPKLEDVSARQATYLTDDADWIDYSATVCTDPEQVALSPGMLQREFTRDGRRCFEYAMEQPMLDFYSVLSARYAVKKDHHNGIAIEVYYDPAHAWNVARMIESAKDALAYYQAHFTPYQFRQLRILEFPNYQSFAQSFAALCKEACIF